MQVSMRDLWIFIIIETGKHEKEHVTMQITPLSRSRLIRRLFAPVSETRGSQFFLNKRQE